MGLCAPVDTREAKTKTGIFWMGSVSSQYLKYLYNGKKYQILSYCYFANYSATLPIIVKIIMLRFCIRRGLIPLFILKLQYILLLLCIALYCKILLILYQSPLDFKGCSFDDRDQLAMFNERQVLVIHSYIGLIFLDTLII